METLSKAPLIDLHPGDFSDVTGMNHNPQSSPIEAVDMQLDEAFGVVRPCLLDSVHDINDSSTLRRERTDFQFNVYDVSAIANGSDFYETGSEMFIDLNELSLEPENERGLAAITFGNSGLCTTASAFMQDLANIFGPLTIDSDGILLFSNPTTGNQHRITALEEAELELLQCQLLSKASKPYIPFNCDHLSD